MDTDKLKYFVAVAESGSLTKASQIIGISHSGLSKAIAALELETNLQLFRPQGRGLEITPEGQWFYKKAQDILKISSEILNRLPPAATPLRIGLSGVIAMTCSGALVKEVGGSLLLNEIEVGEVEGKIIDGELDFGIAFIPSPKPELEYLELGEVHFGSYAREDLALRFEASSIPFAVPISEFPTNPLGYRNRDGWPGLVLRNPQYAVSGFAIALDLLRSGCAAIYMANFVATAENAQATSGKKFIALSDHRAAQTKRKLYLVKRQNIEETKVMKKVAKVIRRLCCSKS